MTETGVIIKEHRSHRPKQLATEGQALIPRHGSGMTLTEWLASWSRSKPPAEKFITIPVMRLSLCFAILPQRGDIEMDVQQTIRGETFTTGVQMKKADHDTDRQVIQSFQQIINVGLACEKDFKVLGIKTPQQLIGRDPLKLYRKLCKVTGVRHDPCVLDVLMASVDYMNGNPPKKWWCFTAERKEKYGVYFRER